MRPFRRNISLGGSLVGLGVAITLLAGCGGTASAATSGATASTSTTATATAACKPFTLTTAQGTINAVSGHSITVIASSGKQTAASLSSSTRIIKQVAMTVSALTPGTAVQVRTDTNVTTAQRITIVSGSAGAGRFGGFGRASGTGGTSGSGSTGGVSTNRARRNPACRPTNSGRFAGRGGAGGSTTFTGLLGTVQSATATTLIVQNAQGTPVSVAITPQTAIATSVAGTLADLKVGATALLSCTGASGHLTARSINLVGASSATSAA